MAGVLAVLAGLAGMGPAWAADAGARPRPGERRTLTTFPASEGVYELGLEACKIGEQEHSPGLFRCPFSVRLSVAGKVVSQEELPYRACGAPEPMEVDRLLGADPHAQAWTSSDDCEVQVAARAVEMAPGITALLVTQRTGSEAYYRRHQLFLASGGQLTEVWKHSEEQGRDWSTTSVLPTGRPHREDIVLLEVASSAAEGARSITATRLRLDASSGRISASPLPDARAPLYVLRVGRFASATAAYGARGRCLDDFQALNARLFPGLGLRDFFLGMVVATQAQSKEALARLASCPGAPRASLHLFRNSGGKR